MIFTIPTFRRFGWTNRDLETIIATVNLFTLREREREPILAHRLLAEVSVLQAMNVLHHTHHTSFEFPGCDLAAAAGDTQFAIVYSAHL